jgi:hypothetical protein
MKSEEPYIIRQTQITYNEDQGLSEAQDTSTFRGP